MSIVSAQAPDPALPPLQQAYEALRTRDYETAIQHFRRAVDAAPKRSSIHKDLAYAYLKIGESEAARDEFLEATKLDPKDTHVALEYGFLCNETKQPIQARRVFDQIRKSGEAADRATRRAGVPEYRPALARRHYALDQCAGSVAQ